MRIEILTTDGSPLGVSSKSIWGDQWHIGVGGAELALLTMCETWHQLGHEVILYNDPKEPNASPFEQRRKSEFETDTDRDILIVFRTPNVNAIPAKGLKVWWSCDQGTKGKYGEYAQFMDKIVVISPFHQQYFKDTFHIENTIVIDLSVRLDDYNHSHIEKIPGRMIFTSVPDRGLMGMRSIWKTIHSAVPETSLVITSDYRLWGVPFPGDGPHRSGWASFIGGGVFYLGAVTRARLIDEQLKAQLFVYPCIYDELFCIACAEAQVAGALPITTGQGALRTTNMGHILTEKSIPETLLWLLNNPDILKAEQDKVQKLSIKRFNPLSIASQWDKLVFGG